MGQSGQLITFLALKVLVRYFASMAQICGWHKRGAMENHADTFLDKFYNASVQSGTTAASYKAKLTARAMRAVIAALDAGISGDEP
jgi:hypothetical protein